MERRDKEQVGKETLDSFRQLPLIEHLLCARGYFRCWSYSSRQDSQDVL